MHLFGHNCDHDYYFELLSLIKRSSGKAHSTETPILKLALMLGTSQGGAPVGKHGPNSGKKS